MKPILKSLLTVLWGIILLLVALSIGKNKQDSMIWIWIICGIPYGIPRIRMWFVLHNGSVGSSAAVFVLNFIIAGLLGGFIYIWTMFNEIINIAKLCFEKVKRQ